MKFKESSYYDEKFLGKVLYRSIDNDDKILTVYEYFEINDKEKEYIKRGTSIRKKYYNYKLVIKDNYYELDCQDIDPDLFLVFDKPVHITSIDCSRIISPEIVVKSSRNISVHGCVANKVTINNKCLKYYNMNFSKINSVYFYNSKVSFWGSEIDNFFILDKNLVFHNSSKFLYYHTLKFFGECADLKEKILNNKEFKEGIIHIE